MYTELFFEAKSWSKILNLNNSSNNNVKTEQWHFFPNESMPFLIVHGANILAAPARTELDFKLSFSSS